MATKVLTLIRKRLEFFERPDSVHVQILCHLRFVSLRIPLREHLYERYGQDGRDGPASRDGVGSLFKTCANIVLINGDSSRQKPHPLLACMNIFDRFRIISTIWLIYVLIKFCIDYKSLENLLGLPSHCLLAGRLIVYEGLSDIIACQFAILHLSWRTHQWLRSSHYRLSVINFFLLNTKQLEMIYNKFNYDYQTQTEGSIELTEAEFEQLDAKSKLTLDTMCFVIRRRTKLIYKLRSNRTRESHLVLRRTLSQLSLMAISAFFFIEMCILSLVLIHVTTDEYYLKHYPDCGQPTGLHRYYALLMDVAENFILYFEGGIVWSAMGCMTVLNLDLFTLWSGIKRQIDDLRGSICEANERHLVAFEHRTIIGRRSSGRFQLEVQELISRMVDFFEQVSRADEVISAFLIGLLGSSLLICGQFTYYTRVQVIRQLPVQVGLMAAFVLVWILSAAYGFLMLHSHCESSYVRLCSLIAHDLEKFKHKFKAVLDYFNMRRSCFTLMNGVPFLPTTFFTMIGWVFSCFCIITGMLRDSERRVDLVAHRAAANSTSNGTSLDERDRM